jgi:hypothetical protein
MPASHCPEFDSRWTHDVRNIHIRVWSCVHLNIRVNIFIHRLTAGRVFPASAATSCVGRKSLACQKTAEGTPEGSFSCPLRVFILPFVRPSRERLGESRHLRFYVAWSPVSPGVFVSRKNDEGNKKLPNYFRKATRISEVLVIPSCSHRILVTNVSFSNTMAIRWNFGAGEDVRIWLARAFYAWLCNRSGVLHCTKTDIFWSLSFGLWLKIQCCFVEL